MNVYKKQLNKIEESCDEIKTRISVIETTLAVNTASLKEHMRRTEINEEAIKTIVVKALPPIRRSVDRVNFVVRLIPWVLTVIAAIIAIVFKSGISIF